MSASRRALVGGGLLFAALLLAGAVPRIRRKQALEDRKSTRLNSSHGYISYAVFCLKKKKTDYDSQFPSSDNIRADTLHHNSSSQGAEQESYQCTLGDRVVLDASVVALYVALHSHLQ